MQLESQLPSEQWVGRCVLHRCERRHAASAYCSSPTLIQISTILPILLRIVSNSNFNINFSLFTTKYPKCPKAAIVALFGCVLWACKIKVLQSIAWHHMAEHICAEISLENIFGFTTGLLATDSSRRSTVSSQQISELASSWHDDEWFTFFMESAPQNTFSSKQV